MSGYVYFLYYYNTIKHYSIEYKLTVPYFKSTGDSSAFNHSPRKVVKGFCGYTQKNVSLWRQRVEAKTK